MIPFSGFAPELDAMFGTRQICIEECHKAKDKDLIPTICAKYGFRIKDFTKAELDYMLS